MEIRWRNNLLPPKKEGKKEEKDRRGREFQREEELPGQNSERIRIHLKSLSTPGKLKPFKRFFPSTQLTVDAPPTPTSAL